MKFRLAKQAQADLDSIWDYSFITWDEKRADLYIDALFARFEWLTKSRLLWRERNDIRPGLFSYPEHSHLIIFREVQGNIEIVRVLHGRMDIKRHLS